jgi:hypothetical protein
VRRPIPNSPLSVQASLYNAFNTNTFGGLVTPNAGTPLVGSGCASVTSGVCNGVSYGQYKSSVPFPLIPVQPRTLRVQLDYSVGGR